MKKETYIAITQPLRDNPARAKAINVANKLITRAIYVAYPLLLVWLFVRPFLAGNAGAGDTGTSDTFQMLLENKAAWKALLVPGISFVLVSIFRDKLNAPRPYEVFSMAPVIPKDTKGHSFPSRHTFSIFVIGMAFLASLATPVPGAVVLTLGVALAAIRVVSGVHFPRDVIAGAAIGVLCGIIGFYLVL